MIQKPGPGTNATISGLWDLLDYGGYELKLFKIMDNYPYRNCHNAFRVSMISVLSLKDFSKFAKM